jgi:hypothetical protein
MKSDVDGGGLAKGGAAAEDVDHLISPKELLRVAMARQ